MCKTNEEIQELVNTMRSLKTMKAEIDAEISAIQNELMTFLKDEGYEEKQAFIGSDFILKWGTCNRSTFDRSKLEKVLGSDLSDFQKFSSFDRLYIS